MSDPIDLQIIANLKAQLQTISVSGGYFYDIEAIAVALDPDQSAETLISPDGPRPMIFIQIGVGADGWKYSPADQVRVDMPVTLHWIHNATPGVDNARAVLFFKGSADVEKCLCSDRSLGGLAFDVLINSRSLGESADSGQEVWVTLQTTISFYRTYGQP